MEKKPRTAKIIKFPKKQKMSMRRLLTRQAADIADQETADRVNLIKAYHINDTVDAIMPILLSNIELSGFELQPADCPENYMIKDGTLVMEAIRSLLCKHYDIYHPIQAVAENIFIFNERKEFNLAKKLKVDLTEREDTNKVSVNDKTGI